MTFRVSEFVVVVASRSTYSVRPAHAAVGTGRSRMHADVEQSAIYEVWSSDTVTMPLLHLKTDVRWNAPETQTPPVAVVPSLSTPFCWTLNVPPVGDFIAMLFVPTVVPSQVVSDDTPPNSMPPVDDCVPAGILRAACVRIHIPVAS